MTRKVCVVTGTRADYGLLRMLMHGIRESSDLELQVIATGMHLSPEFGLTYREIEKDEFKIDARIETLISSDTHLGIAKSVGLGVIGFADAYDRLRPDIVLVLGDRFEIFAATQAAFFAGISVGHISGGEVTEGALDDSMRHCISKMARYHFVAAETYRSRVIQLGEQPESVFNVGDPGLDNIADMSLLSRDDLGLKLGLNLLNPYFLVTYHPATTGDLDLSRNVQALFDALDEFPDFNVLLTKSNADAGGRLVNAMVDTYSLVNPNRVFAVTSLGQLNYLSALKSCEAVVGNSSSGIVEAPAMGVPTVNIGTRQLGRLKASSIVDCAEDLLSVRVALAKAIGSEFKKNAAQTQSLYGNCDASKKILSKLLRVDVDKRYAKRFYDLPS